MKLGFSQYHATQSMTKEDESEDSILHQASTSRIIDSQNEFMRMNTMFEKIV